MKDAFLNSAAPVPILERGLIFGFIILLGVIANSATAQRPGLACDTCALRSLATPSHDTLAALAHLVMSQEPGVRMENGQLTLSPLARQLYADSTLRAATFPAQYTWEGLVQKVNANEILPAFWHLINLFPQNPDLAVRVGRLLCGQQLDPAAVLPNAFHTYAYFDPQMMAFVNQRPNLMQPVLFQAKLSWCRALVAALAVPPPTTR